MFVRRKRFEELEKTVKELSEKIEELCSTTPESAERKKHEPATLTKILNEWVYGKESGDGE